MMAISVKPQFNGKLGNIVFDLHLIKRISAINQKTMKKSGEIFNDGTFAVRFASPQTILVRNDIGGDSLLSEIA